MADCAHGERVVADHLLSTAEHVCRGGTARRGDASGLSQPSIEGVDPAVEILKSVIVPKRLDGTERVGVQRGGIGLCVCA